MSGADLDTFTTFGEYLRYLRRRARLTQRQLGIAIGYSDVHIARLESNQRTPDIAAVRARFIEALNLQYQPALAARLVELAAASRPASGRRTPQPPTPAPIAQLERRTNLPAQLTRFIGREHEVESVRQLLDHNRLVTLTGSGGIGKTRLAFEVGASYVGAMHRLEVPVDRGAVGGASPLPMFPDGVWLVELAPVSDPALMPQIMATAFGLPDPVGSVGYSYLNAVLDFLHDRQLLLLLDNCEHLVGACAELAEALLRACPELHILATSREPLRASAEVVWRVPSMATPDPLHLPSLPELLDYEAVQLFVERASAAQPGFTLTAVTAEDLSALVQVCHDLDGIPLALELAAARLPGLSLREIAARLDDRFRLLTGGRRTALPRQQTLRATLDWSYDLLSELERSLLRRLSVFVAGFRAEAAESVAVDAGAEATEVLPGLLNLVDKSLVVAEQGTLAEAQSGAMRGEHTRYRMLETVRQYAAERLAEADEATQVHDRYLDYFLAWASHAEDLHWIDLEMELDNCRAALTWGLSAPVTDERGLNLVAALEPVWGLQWGHMSEGRAWAARALSKWTEPTLNRAHVLYVTGYLAHAQGDHVVARAQLAESVQLYRDFGAQVNLVDALERLSQATRLYAADLSSAPGTWDEADGYMVEALSLARAIGHQQGVAYALACHAQTSLMPAQLNEARASAMEGLEIFQGMGHKHGICVACHALANIAMAAQDWSLARTYLEQAIQSAVVEQDVLQLALVVREQGDYARAMRLLEECQAMPIFIESGGGRHILTELGRTLQLQGELEGAVALIEESARLSREAGDRTMLAHALNVLGALWLAQGDYGAAARYYQESLTENTTSKFGVVDALVGLAEVAWSCGQWDRAARLCGAVAKMGDVTRLAVTLIEVYPYDVLACARRLEALRAQLVDADMAAAWAEGAELSLDQALDYAGRH